MDRLPLPPPFAKGTMLRYRGTRRSWTTDVNGNDVAIAEPGMVVAIDGVRVGRRGTLLPLPVEWEDGEGEPVLDETTDGYCTYSVPVAGRRPAGRIIWPKDAAEWEVVE